MKDIFAFALFAFIILASQDFRAKHNPSRKIPRIGQWDHRPSKDVTT